MKRLGPRQAKPVSRPSSFSEGGPYPSLIALQRSPSRRHAQTRRQKIATTLPMSVGQIGHLWPAAAHSSRPGGTLPLEKLSPAPPVSCGDPPSVPFTAYSGHIIPTASSGSDRSAPKSAFPLAATPAPAARCNYFKNSAPISGFLQSRDGSSVLGGQHWLS